MKKQHQIVIISGGTAGIMTATQLLKKNNHLDIAIIDPADTHYYQPAWTLVGAGAYDYDNNARSMASLIPKKASWIKDFVTSFNADENTLDTKNSGQIGYKFLVVAPGLVMYPSLIEGLPEAMEKGIVCSNYTDPKHTWETIKNWFASSGIQVDSELVFSFVAEEKIAPLFKALRAFNESLEDASPIHAVVVPIEQSL